MLTLYKETYQILKLLFPKRMEMTEKLYRKKQVGIESINGQWEFFDGRKEPAIVDLQLTETVPLKITMKIRFDVLAHAVESCISKAATPYMEMQSEHVIRIVRKYLPRLAHDLREVEAREK